MSYIFVKQGLSNIRSNYILKEICSFISYHKILKIINYNKEIQSKLSLKIDDYKNESNSPKYDYIQVIRKYRKEENDEYQCEQNVYLFNLYSFIIRIIYLIGYLYFGHRFYFHINNKYIQKCNDTVIKIEKYSLLIIIFDGLYFLLLYYYLLKKNSFHWRYIGPRTLYIINYKIHLSSIIFIIINITNFIFFGFCIYKFILYNKIFSLHILIILIEIVFYFFHIIDSFSVIFVTYLFLKRYYTWYIEPLHRILRYLLISFNDIKIEYYELPKDFNILDKNKRKILVKNIYANFESLIPDKFFELVDKINILRKENDIEEE